MHQRPVSLFASLFSLLSRPGGMLQALMLGAIPLFPILGGLHVYGWSARIAAARLQSGQPEPDVGALGTHMMTGLRLFLLGFLMLPAMVVSLGSFFFWVLPYNAGPLFVDGMPTGALFLRVLILGLLLAVNAAMWTVWPMVVTLWEAQAAFSDAAPLPPGASGLWVRLKASFWSLLWMKLETLAFWLILAPPISLLSGGLASAPLMGLWWAARWEALARMHARHCQLGQPRVASPDASPRKTTVMPALRPRGAQA